MLDAIFKRVDQMSEFEFYLFCAELYCRGASSVYYDDGIKDPADPDEKPRFVGLLAEIVELIGGEENGNG